MLGTKITDAAKATKLLLDTILESKSVATALLEFHDTHKRVNDLPKAEFNDLDEMIRALDFICNQGRQKASKVSPVANLLMAYDMRQKSDDAGVDS